MDALEGRLAAAEGEDAEHAKIGLDDLDPLLKFMIEDDPFAGTSLISIPSEGYGVSQTTHGPIAVSFEGIIGVGAGSKITLEFVNMAAVTISTADIKVVYYGKRGEDGIFGEVTQQLTNPLREGTSLRFPVTIKDAKPDELSNIVVTVTPKSIGYRKG